MEEDREDYVDARDRVQWLTRVRLPRRAETRSEDDLTKHDILVECNFVEPEQICLAGLREG